MMPTAAENSAALIERDEERHAGRLQQRLGIGAGREERRMAERDLPGVADQQHQPETDDGVDADEMKLREHVAADEERRGEQQHAEQAVPEDLSAMLEQADVLVVIGLEDEAHLQTFFRAVSPKMPDGMNSSTTSTTT